MGRPGPRPSTAPGAKTTGAVPKVNGDKTPTPKEEAPAKPRPRPSSLQPPAMAPRQNKSALLRAAKMAGAALGATSAKKPAAHAPRAVRA